jgi:hypothetical protein
VRRRIALLIAAGALAAAGAAPIDSVNRISVDHSGIDTSHGASGKTDGQLSGVSFDFSTHKRLASGSDNWPITWAVDNNLYTSWGDGGGFGGTNSDGRTSLGFARVTGSAKNYQGKNAWGGKDSQMQATFGGKTYSLVSIDGTLYSWIGLDEGDGSEEQFRNVRLYKSADLARTWTSTGQEIDTADFSGAFSHPNILNFGRDNTGSRDSYVYTYWVGEKPMDFSSSCCAYLTRVHKSDIDRLASYEVFTGMSVDGQPEWSSDWDAREPVYRGPVHWTFNVVYIAGIKKYVLINNRASSSSRTTDLEWLESNFPWGPWRWFAIFRDWRPPGSTDEDHYIFFVDIPVKWQSPNGSEFTLVYTGTGIHDAWNTVRGRFAFQ